MAFGSIDRAVDSKPRMTKQGIRDLNYYGPKPAKGQARARPAADRVAETSDSAVIVPKNADVALAVDA
jgi:hypothetical protein